MSLKEDLKRVIGPSKEDIELQEWVRRQPPTTLKKANAQFRASAEFERKSREEESTIHNPHSGQHGS